MEIEIARYPVRCHRCGRTEQVCVCVDDMCGDDKSFMDSGQLPTIRTVATGWRWEWVGGFPLWVCPSCSAYDCGHCTHIRASDQDGALYCQIAGREVCATDQPCAVFARLEDA
jgi:hypothetical protein